ncbi:glutathione S-transferase family protein [Halopseudomonas nanhaiensis]|uniref:glutathione S-transferase family protein n=1 Tax=Halopseudomonas nanhaiensis TaxID=2830842 RepID=UPI001CBBEA08|nr:glutathione S-transferase family protein [Halopseudomonas nanhaiensis]UAW99645.1 glutathione S-transferase family protein [Halopseudomonas nanhaiensis]
MSTASPYILYGVPHSLYTGKARCYLRNQGIEYVERPTSHPDFASRIVPLIGRGIIPVLETPDGEVIQDTIDIIDHFEQRGVQYPAYPEGPLQRAVAVIIEYYGGQAMLKQSMHYRWSYREQQEAFLHHAFASGSGADFADKVMGRMQSYLPRLGVTEQSIAHIERSYETLLDLLEDHFQHWPYLLGGRPCIADYGLIASMFAHLGRDPVPAQIMKTRAPRVYRWVERMTAPGLDVTEYAGCAAELVAGDRIPPSLEPVLRHIAADIFPELTDKLVFIDAWVDRVQPADGDPVTDKPQQRQLGLVKTHYHDAPVEVGVEPYLLYVLQRAVAPGLETGQVQQVVAKLGDYGLGKAVPLGGDYRVGRQNNIEVWQR